MTRSREDAPRRLLAAVTSTVQQFFVLAVSDKLSALSPPSANPLTLHSAMCTSAASRNVAILSVVAPSIRIRVISLSSACFTVYGKVEESALHWTSRITQSRCFVSPN